ncbi:MAG: hypothetical protein ABFS32_17320 [Bacteroidota bacterium]
MNIEKLIDCLSVWMGVDTWHTGHPLDEERFYTALSRAFEEFGYGISDADFHEAMEAYIEKLGINLDENEYYQDEIDSMVSKADAIASYLRFTSGG